MTTALTADKASTRSRAEIRDRVTQSIIANPSARQMDPETRKKLIQDTIAAEEARMGLNVPIAIRNARYLTNALTLQLGRAINMTSDAGSKQVRLILLERLPATLLLMGVSQLFLFITSVLLALNLSRRYGSLWDKVVVALSPTSAVPAWFYGIFLILIFASFLRALPFGGMVASPPPTNPIASVRRTTIAEEWHTISLALFKQCSRTQRCFRMPHLRVQ